MAGRSKSIFAELAEAPWWLSLVAALMMYVALRWIIPATISADRFPGKMLHDTALAIAPIVFVVFLIPIPFSLWNAWRRKQLLGRAHDAEAVRSMPWHEFETLVAEAFRRIGYAVEERGGPAADGGVDLILREDGKVTLVQCKHWKSRQVGVTIARELAGVMAVQRAQAGIIVTGGAFTQEAQAFAAQTNIELVNGERLRLLLAHARGEATKGRSASVADAETPPTCPRCATPMVKRMAKRGVNVGAEFWGCGRYPSCDGTRPFVSAAPERSAQYRR